jgi:hypothetical protein
MTCSRACVAAKLITAVLIVLLLPGALVAQRGQAAPAQAPLTPQAAAPIDLTGYWISMIVDEWRFRVTPQKGDILYLPLNNNARQAANAWDPAKDEADGKQCKAYGAVGVMQRPGRLHVTWADANTLKIETDAGTQTRLLHFGAPSGTKGPPSWQGDSVADWQTPGGGRRGAPATAAKTGNLRVVTSNMLPGYIRKNGVPYSDGAVLTEYFNVLTGQQNDVYMAVTAMVEDPTYLTQPFVRTYQFKKAADAAGWEPTPCWNR